MTSPSGTASRRFSPADLCLCALFVAVMVLCAWITVPGTVPFTLQNLGVFAALTVLGGKRGTLSVTVYLLLGLAGAPVFSGFRGGPGVLFGATGGYLLGFLVLSAVFWGITRQSNSRKRQALGLLAGQLLCYLLGTVWFTIAYTAVGEAAAPGTVLLWCVVPFVVPDGVKVWLALLLADRLRRKGYSL